MAVIDRHSDASLVALKPDLSIFEPPVFKHAKQIGLYLALLILAELRQVTRDAASKIPGKAVVIVNYFNGRHMNAHQTYITSSNQRREPNQLLRGIY